MRTAHGSVGDRHAGAARGGRARLVHRRRDRPGLHAVRGLPPGRRGRVGARRAGVSTPPHRRPAHRARSGRTAARDRRAGRDRRGDARGPRAGALRRGGAAGCLHQRRRRTPTAYARRAAPHASGDRREHPRGDHARAGAGAARRLARPGRGGRGPTIPRGRRGEPGVDRRSDLRERPANRRAGDPPPRARGRRRHRAAARAALDRQPVECRRGPARRVAGTGRPAQGGAQQP
jgi:hypothetical protein